MRETIELLKEESLMKNELLAKYEREQQKGEDEVSYFFQKIQILSLTELIPILFDTGSVLQEAKSRLNEET
jgi:hypothetical protein